MNNNELICNFWNRVTTELKRQKKTQIELCNFCNFSLNSFRVKISQQNAPSVFAAYQIAQFLNTTVEYLVSGEYSTDSNNLELLSLKDKINRIETICKE